MQADTDQRRWFKHFARREAAQTKLICFHCAGGNAAMFRDWPGLLPECIEPVAVQLPGRLDRLGEAPFRSMERLIDELAGVMMPMLDRPFALYGVSMGARIAWTLTHALRDRGLAMPRALYVASNAAPGTESAGREWDQPDSRLAESLRLLGGTPREILADPGMLARVVSVLRADLTVLGTQAFRPAVPLDVPIRAFAGRQDIACPPERMSGWRDETRAPCDLHVVPGGHFFSPEVRRQVAGIIASDLG